ncbi:CRAL-TRIO domain-containing protein [Pyronema omphalodes]|nr:CRAL-TRIO domain-containing protein [Pyronema omphalodes]
MSTEYTYPATNPNAEPGHPGNTTPEDDARVIQLREQLHAEGYTDRTDTNTLLRFLRAVKNEADLVGKAKDKFVEVEKWRKEFEVDKLVAEFEYTEKDKVFEYYPQYYHKTDKDGRPLYFERLGKINLKKMKTITDEKRMIQNLVVEYERVADDRLPACSRKAGKLLETCCTVLDLQGVGPKTIWDSMDFLRKINQISSTYYPERLGKLLIINPPTLFNACFNTIKGFLDPVTANKIKICKLPELLEYIPAENLPVDFGGKCTCEDLGGCHRSDAGPWNEEKYTQPSLTDVKL